MNRVKTFEEFVNENMVTESSKKKIKRFRNVKVGDDAYENPVAGGNWDNKIGTVLWTGDLRTLKKSKYKHLIDDWVENGAYEDELEGYDLIVIDLDSYDGGPTLFNYDNDPSGTVVFESKINENKEFKVSGENDIIGKVEVITKAKDEEEAKKNAIEKHEFDKVTNIQEI